jgi:hypothetical protein
VNEVQRRGGDIAASLAPRLRPAGIRTEATDARARADINQMVRLASNIRKFLSRKNAFKSTCNSILTTIIVDKISREFIDRINFTATGHR